MDWRVGAVAWASASELGFQHMETTGVTSYVHLNGQVVAIEWADDSDPSALRSLHALDARVFLPNADGRGIVVEGVLDRELRWCDSVVSQLCRDFHLRSWHLVAPFDRWGVMPELENDVLAVCDDRLTAADFGGLDVGDVAAFVR